MIWCVWFENDILCPADSKFSSEIFMESLTAFGTAFVLSTSSPLVSSSLSWWGCCESLIWMLTAAHELRKRTTNLILLKHSWHNSLVNLSFLLTWKWLLLEKNRQLKRQRELLRRIYSRVLRRIWIFFRSKRCFYPEYLFCGDRRFHTVDMVKMPSICDFSPFYFQFFPTEIPFAIARCWSWNKLAVEFNKMNNWNLI